MAMVSEMAIRQRAADTASSEDEWDIRGPRILEDLPITTPQNSKATPRPVTGQGVALFESRKRLSYFSGLSSGAPVPDEPTKSFLPSGNVMSRPLARLAPSLAWKPSTRISVPSVNEFLFQPRRSSAFGAPPSTIQRSTFPVEGSFTSIWIHEWGLIH